MEIVIVTTSIRSSIPLAQHLEREIDSFRSSNTPEVQFDCENSGPKLERVQCCIVRIGVVGIGKMILVSKGREVRTSTPSSGQLTTP